MIKVQCPSCSAPYDLDEARLPATGVKMRCPKCGNAFRVFPTGETGPADQKKPAAAGPQPAPPAPAPPVPTPPKPKAPRKATVVGVGPSSKADLEQSNRPTPPRAFPAPDLADLPAPAKRAAPKPFSGPGTKPKPPQAFKLKPPAMPDRSNQKTPPRDFAAPAPNDVALPSPKGRRPNAPRRPVAPQHKTKPREPAVKPGAKTPAAPFPGVDLPAPVQKKAAAPPFSGAGGGVGLPGVKKPIPKGTMVGLGDLDLPAPKPAAAKAPLAPAFPGPAPSAPDTAKTPFDDLEDLPAPVAGGVDLPGLKAPGPSGMDEASFAGLDLPAPKSPAQADEMSFADLDLPAPKGGGVDLPAPKSPALSDEMSFADLDLPAPKGGGVDLPAPKNPGMADEMSFADLDLPAPKGAAAGGGDLDMELGLAGGTAAGLGDLDLPMPKGGSGGAGDLDLDLPMPKGGSVDLPTPKSGGLDSGGLFDDLDLPMPKVGADLPTPKAAGADLPIARGDADLPQPRGGFGELDLPGIGGEEDELDLLGGADFGAAAGAAGAVALGGGFGGGAGDELELPLPDDELGGGLDLETADGRAGAGGVGFGEIDLSAESADDAGMEFADLPTEERNSRPGRLPKETHIGIVKDERTKAREARAAEGEGAAEGESKRAIWPLVALAAVLVVAGVGVGLGFTPYGYFGIFLGEQLLPEAGSAAEVNPVIATAEEEAAADTYDTVRSSLGTLGRARSNMGLNRELLARSLLHESLFQARFGENPASAGRASAILNRLQERSYEGSGMQLAEAAVALAAGDGSRARALAGQAQGSLANDPYVYLVGGEAALLQGQPEQAAELFATSAEKGGGARAMWGRARALLLLESPEAEAAVDETLEESRRHSEARIEKARFLLAAGELVRAKTLAQQAAGVVPVGDTRLRSTMLTRAAAHTLLGRIAEREGNRREARESYSAALEADASDLFALVGAGRAFLTDERWRDALTRFEAAIDTAGGGAVPEVEEGERPLLAEARFGAARAMFRLDREQDAKRVLEELAVALPEDGEVTLWLGRVLEHLEDVPNAESRYQEAVTLMPDRFEPYLALAQLFFATDRPSEAGATLALARERVPESAVMRRLLGEAELQRRRNREAIEEFTRALALDDTDVASRYGLGVAYRRSGELEQANVAFAEVAEVDPAWPGLALERGLVFEARGESDQAVQAYQLALEDRPNDPDLLLRLGAAYVSDGRVDEAEETLHRVQESRPNSAEVEHFMGRVSMARGNLPVAMNHFTRSIALDPSRGEFHLYVGWAALEMGNLGRALDEVNEAITRDPSLGDAYWIRGRVRLRGGAVRDALSDLERALALKPSRYEAWAAIAESYDGLRRVPEAIEAYRNALDRDNSKGKWWFRLGQLQLDAGRRSQAIPSLERATLIGDALDEAPPWLADAHRLLGLGLRTSNRAQAVAHLRRYLEVAPDNAIDRNEVRSTLMEMGESP